MASSCGSLAVNPHFVLQGNTDRPMIHENRRLAGVWLCWDWTNQIVVLLSGLELGSPRRSATRLTDPYVYIHFSV